MVEVLIVLECVVNRQRELVFGGLRHRPEHLAVARLECCDLFHLPGSLSANDQLFDRCTCSALAAARAAVAAALKLMAADDDAEVRRRAGEALTQTPGPHYTPAPSGERQLVLA